MTLENTTTLDSVIGKYMDYVLTHGEQPKTVYSFCKENDFEESDFYNHFSDFTHLEKELFATFCKKAVLMLENSNETKTYDSKQKLIGFYFTFFEMLTANRSFVLLRLKENSNKLKALKTLSGLRNSFTRFLETLDFDTIDFKQDNLNKIQDKGMKEIAWFQLLYTIQFWMNDDSKGFEKTDIFIEKSLKASFDLTDMAPVNSVFDLAKFLYKEKMGTK